MISPKIKTLVVDDEASNRENVQMLLREFCPDIDVVGDADGLKQAREKIEKLSPELVFFDIQFGGETVFSLLTELEQIDFAIIFMTAHQNYALEAFEYHAVDYLVKPIQIPALVKAVNEAVARIRPPRDSSMVEDVVRHLRDFQRNQHKLALATTKGYELVYISNIMYCEANGSYTKFVFESGEPLVVSRNLKYYENILAEYDFIRAHNTTLVNLQYISVLERTGGGAIILENGTSLPVSRAKRQELDQMIKEKRRLL